MIVVYEKEASIIFSEVKDEPALRKVGWFGIDNLMSPGFYPPEGMERIANFLALVNFTLSKPYAAGNPLTPSFVPAFNERFGYDPKPYSDHVYDCMWVAVWAVLIQVTTMGR